MNILSNKRAKKIEMHFEFRLELPDSDLKRDVLNISTSLYLPKEAVDKLRKAAQVLLE